MIHNYQVGWIVAFHESFEPEFDALPEDVQDEMMAQAILLVAGDIAKADDRFGEHLARAKAEGRKKP